MTAKPQGLSISATIVMFIMMEHMNVTAIIVRVKKSKELQDDARLKFYVKWCPKMARPANMVPEKEMALNGSCCGPSCGLGRSHVVVDFVKRESKKVDRYNVITDTGDDSRKHFLKWEAS